MTNYLGDFDRENLVTFAFTTHDAAGGAVAPSSAFEAADLRIYKGSSATERTSAVGITMTSPFDSVTGLHLVSIDPSDDTDAGFWEPGNDYHVVLVPDETVDGQTVVAVLATFSIENRFATVHTATMGVGAITNNAFAAGAITAGAIAADAIGASELAADAVSEIQNGLATSANQTTILGRLPTTLVSGRIDASVGAMAANVLTASAIATGAIDADALASDVISDIFQGTALTEAYAADGAAATPAQLLYMIYALLAEKAVSGTTVTVKKLDGSTTAMTFTLSDATNPTSVSRAS